ncbi:glycosyltransferase family 4 protein [Glutamicibacter sp.]|uniref:glycosyltransferase family 4 protein n=1 Tax=Glutamicibacter sp. TaxID=1931995 RepID=UPI002B46585C|nr:glycosyltransferase [Glutamicibacter sp.]HJX80220.1 glycosyltransferase [Glutamicibacter sp.]
MRILIYPHDLAMGGSQLNAIELAGALRDRGHEVIVYGWEGELVHKVRELGLEFIQSPRPRFRPTPAIVADLRRLVRERQIDIVHGFEWPPALECALATLGLKQTKSIATVMSMAVADFIPRTMSLTVGTEQIKAERNERGFNRVSLLEPPVDVHTNNVHQKLGREFRTQYSINSGVPLVVVVSRLVPELKLEGILSAIDTIAQIAEERPICLAIIGGGSAADTVSERAEQVNSRYPGSIVLTGEMADPRPAYAAADIALGMGGSALRAMAFAKPLIVQGEKGYWKLLEPDSADEFFWQGWYGVGTADHGGTERLTSILLPLLDAGRRQSKLGDFGRGLVESRYSLESLSRTLEDLYTAERTHRVRLVNELGSWSLAAWEFTKYKLARLRQKLWRKTVMDDFNSNTVSARFGPRRSDTSIQQVIYLAGTFWDDIKGTDHMLATALSAQTEVIWVDPPRTLKSSLTTDGSRPAKLFGTSRDQVAGKITRIQTFVPVGVRYPWLRKLYDKLTVRTLLRVAGTKQPAERLIIHSSASASFPTEITGTKYLYVTDDWIAGEQLMGLPAGSVSERLNENLAVADKVFAVSPHLAAQLDQLQSRQITNLLPNGCKISDLSAGDRQPVIAVLGQLNERLDVGLLEEIRDQGLKLRVAGPMKSNNAQWVTRMRNFLESPGVQWVGEIPPTQVPEFLASCRVGLTPYTNSEFNQASFPLKTLDYLAAGLFVVSTNLPSSHWLDTEHLAVGNTNGEVIELLQEFIARPTQESQIAERRDFAAGHSWEQRAIDLIELSSLKEAPIT